MLCGFSVRQSRKVLLKQPEGSFERIGRCYHAFLRGGAPLSSARTFDWKAKSLRACWIHMITIINFKRKAEDFPL